MSSMREIFVDVTSLGLTKPEQGTYDWDMPRYIRDPASPERPLKTAEVARIVGLSQRHLVRRLLKGTLPEPERSPNPPHYRLWRTRDIEALRIALRTDQEENEK